MYGKLVVLEIWNYLKYYLIQRETVLLTLKLQNGRWP